MLKNSYLSVLQFQLKFDIICESKRDVLVENEFYHKQIEKSINVIKNLNPDICIFPEMSYHNNYDNIFRQLSLNGKIIVFGSTYVDGINKTKIYNNGSLNEVTKIYPCGSEPMIRIYEKVNIETFIKKFLKQHEFYIKNHKIYILNCLEYYQSAYFIARDKNLSNNLFAFIVPCSNSNPTVFMEESKAIHNHNENVYSFVCNRIKKDGKSGYGNSYIYGPIQYHEKEWLIKEGVISDKHNASILQLDSSTPSYVYGKYACPESISRFGRSDNYINTPKNIIVKNLL